MCSVNCPYRLGEISPTGSSRKISIRESADAAQARLFEIASIAPATAELLRNCLRSICGSFQNWNCFATFISIQAVLRRFERCYSQAPRDELNLPLQTGRITVTYLGVTSTLQDSVD